MQTTVILDVIYMYNGQWNNQKSKSIALGFSLDSINH